ncbi:hypothetical protein Btru_035424 [Bulinus truncatus]|nr:hypothetical protein Btru_035424 [Bulinus truncatus]
MENWTEEETMSLIKQIVDATSGNNNKSYKTVESSLDWESIQVNDKSVEDCKKIYQQLINKVRKFRTMSEIMSDASALLQEGGFNAELYPDCPKKPVTAYSIFVQKRSKMLTGLNFQELTAQLSQEWKNLPVEKKEVYKKKYLKKKEKYDEDMKAFVEKHPNYKSKHHINVDVKSKVKPKPQPPVPSKLYYMSRLSQVQGKHPEMSRPDAIKHCLNKYRSLSDKRKLKWITKARDAMPAYLQECEEYIKEQPDSKFEPSELHLTKDEQRVLESSRGKPTPPPKNFFLYYQKLKKEDIASVPFVERSTHLSHLYHQQSPEETKQLEDKYIEMVQNYIEQYQAFYDSLSEEDKKREMFPEWALKAYKTVLKNSVKKNSAKESPEKKRKRKLKETTTSSKRSNKKSKKDETDQDPGVSSSSDSSSPEKKFKSPAKNCKSPPADESQNVTSETSVENNDIILDALKWFVLVNIFQVPDYGGERGKICITFYQWRNYKNVCLV